MPATSNTVYVIVSSHVGAPDALAMVRTGGGTYCGWLVYIVLTPAAPPHSCL